MLDYQSWLSSQVQQTTQRMIAVKVNPLFNGNSVFRYFATHQLVDTATGITYTAAITNQFTVTESIDPYNNTASISYGEIELVNENGIGDSFLTSTYVWKNRQVQVYIGSVPASGQTSNFANDFELVFDGIIEDIDSKSRNSLSLKVRDKFEKLNVSLSESLLGNYVPTDLTATFSGYTNPNSGQLKPLCYGEPFNITPLQTFAPALEYMVSADPIESILEVRDNGIPVPFETNTQNTSIPVGSFRLKSSPVGTVTCSVQGIKQKVQDNGSVLASLFDPSASNTILNIVTSKAGLTDFFTTSDFPTTTSNPNFATAKSVGVYVKERQNLLQLCQELAKSCGVILLATRLGKLKLVAPYTLGTIKATITESNMFLNTLQISGRPEIIAGIKLGYAKNWTVQQTLTTDIPQEHKDSYSTEWYEHSNTNDTVKAYYGVTKEPELEPTYLLKSSEVSGVASGIMFTRSQQRNKVKFTGTIELLNLSVGDWVTFSLPTATSRNRFGLNGKTGLVISTQPNWLKGTIEIEVLV